MTDIRYRIDWPEETFDHTVFMGNDRLPDDLREKADPRFYCRQCKEWFYCSDCFRLHCSKHLPNKG